MNKGRFSQSEEAFIRQNYLSMSDREMGKVLNRDFNSIMQYRKRKNLTKQNVKIKDKNLKSQIKKASYLNSLSQEDKKKAILDELRATAGYRTVSKSLTDDEKRYYEEKYLEFMMDPTIETMTSSEKDLVHTMVIAEIRMFRFLEDEKNFRENNSNANRSKEIQECMDTIHKCQKSLNVTREQRLKNRQDQSINFVNILKELQDANKRAEIGYEAAMLKYIAEEAYNNRLNKNILAGDDSEIDLGSNFVSERDDEE